MTDKERYQRTFSTIHTSVDYLKEIKPMKNTKQFRFTKLIAACIAIAVLAAISATAYAVNVGGIQRKIQIWVKGDSTDAVVEISDTNTYVVKYKDKNGNEHSREGGGVAMGLFGIERPLTEEELLMDLYEPEVVYDDDGTVKVCWFDKITDITDKFEDGICHITIKFGDETRYMTIRYKDGYSSSSSKYID